MFAVLQIRRPVLAAACLGVYVAGLMTIFGAAYGKALDDILFDVPIAVAVTTAVAAAANRRVRPGLTGLTTDQVRRVVRWVWQGEVADDPLVAHSVVVYVRNQGQNVSRWGRVCLAGLTFSALSTMVTGDHGMNSAVVAAGFAGAVVVVAVEQRIAAQKRQTAEQAARAVLAVP